MRAHLLPSLSVVLLVLACREDADSPTAPDPSPALATTASTLVFTQISVGNNHRCGVTSDGRLYCWGNNLEGQLGDGTTTDRPAPVPVGGALRFRQVGAGFYMTCAVTTGDRAYCWGHNAVGELGDGTTTARLTPTAVVGGHPFRRVDVGLQHACAVTTDNRGFCWGDNRRGELGIGNNTGPETGLYGAHSTRPVAVAGGLTFRHLTTGHTHSCGVTTDDRVFCWGSNQYGQVGDFSSGWLKVRPVQVAGTQRYQQVDAGRDFTCAVTTVDRAYCWGNGKSGQMGNGTRSSAGRPVPVSGGRSFHRVAAGDFNSCAVTTAGRAYCWPTTDSTQTVHLTPVAVPGGLLFAQLSVGCGVSLDGRGYCWPVGSNGAPAPVPDPM